MLDEKQLEKDVLPRGVTPCAAQSLTDMLKLSRHYGQDWEIEVADATRVEEFCTVYESVRLDNEQQFALMALIVASYDDRLMNMANFGHTPKLEDRIERLVSRDFTLHRSTVLYWCCLGAWEEDPNNPDRSFRVTPLMRHIWEQGAGPLSTGPTAVPNKRG